MSDKRRLIDAEALLYRAFLDKLTYPSATISPGKDWLWLIDNPLLNGEEALALAVAKNRGIIFPFLPEHMHKNIALGGEEIRRRLKHHYAIAIRHKLFTKKIDPDGTLDAFVASAEEVAKMFNSKALIKAMKGPAGKRVRLNPLVP